MIKFGKVRHKPSTILKCIRLYLSYPLSYREIEEIMLGEGIKVDHSTINLWIIRHTPKILKRLQRTKKNIGLSWRMDETYVKVCKVWYFLYRAVDKEGLTIDFYFSKRRNKSYLRRVYFTTIFFRLKTKKEVSKWAIARPCLKKGVPGFELVFKTLV
jgi:putative transposase